MSRSLTCLSLVLLLAAAGCKNRDDGEGDPNGSNGQAVDADEDGSPANQDCDDADPSVYPGAPEVCDGKDNDCDKDTDEAGGPSWYLDTDEDGFGDTSQTVDRCEQPDGYVEASGDCEDDDPTIHPDADEDCAITDRNCDGEASAGAVDAQDWYFDADLDGFGDDDQAMNACAPLAGYIGTGGDCNDADAAIRPTATELCNSVDDDCDGLVDEDDAFGAPTWYTDADADTYGNPALSLVQCVQPAGMVLDGTDCDDNSDAINPAATEVCNGGIDDDCDPATVEDEAVGVVWYVDTDGDGFGAPELGVASCDQPVGTVDVEGDCDDANAAVNPSAAEICNDIDDDCDTEIDEGATDAPTWYVDGDGDGFGTDASAVVQCDAPVRGVAVSGDCDDARPELSPGAEELCNGGVDDDCDATTTDDDSPTAPFWYADLDADLYGDPATGVQGCAQPAGLIADGTDCDDVVAAVNPGAIEVCNGGIDDDCDPTTVDDATGIGWYADNDGDGHGDGVVIATQCDAPANASNVADDCDDADALVSPSADELCSTAYDDDCDGTANEVDAVDAVTWFRDTDADGFGNAAFPMLACNQPPTTALLGTDCNDNDADVYPGAPEICNGGLDDDCDLTTDDDTSPTAPEWYADADDDGFGVAGSTTLACLEPPGYAGDPGDCDDAVATIYPGAPDVCNSGIDDDCNPATDENLGPDASLWFADVDGDLYGDALVSQKGCEQPADHVADDTDCDDLALTTNPGAPEVCLDGVDNDCDLELDEGCYVDHCGTIAVSEVWDETVIHRVTCDIYVQGVGNPVLTITDGTTVVFTAGSGLYVATADDGQLLVQGSSLGVTFTADSASPSPGAWDGVQIGTYDIGSILEGLTLEYGGANAYAGLYLTTSDPVIFNSVIRNNSNDGIYGSTAFPSIRDTEISGNSDYGVYLTSTSGLASGALGEDDFSGNTITANGSRPLVIPARYADEIDVTSSFGGNGDDRVELSADTVDVTSTWNAIDVPYVVSGDIYVQGALNPTLTITDGIVLEHDTYADWYVGNAEDGYLVVAGDPVLGSGVTFTSSAAVPAPGDWPGIQLGTWSDGSKITGATVEYGGSNAYGNIYAYSTTATLIDVTSRLSSKDGLYSGISTVTVQDSTFSDNAEEGLYLDTSSALGTVGAPTFVNNTVTGNTSYAMTLPADSVGQLDATSTFTGNGDIIKVIADTVAASATWQALDADYYIDGDVYVQGALDPTLTIADGAELRFNTYADLYVATADGGKLVVSGAAAGVLFTSSKATPTAGDWPGVQIGTYDLGSWLEGLTVEYGGANAYGNLYVYYADPTLVNVTSSYSSNDGLHATASTVDVSSSTFHDNADYGVELDASSALAPGVPGENSFHDNSFFGNALHPLQLPANYIAELDPSNVFAGANGTDKVAVTYDTVDTTGTWHMLDVPYDVIGDITIQGALNPTITVADGVEMQFGTSVDLYVATGDDGIIDVQGISAGVLFTSNKTVKAPGDWNGMQLGTYSDGSILVGLTLEYGGGNGLGGLYCYYTNATITDCIFQNNANDGIYSAVSTLTVSGTTLSGNSDDGYEGDASSVLLGFTDNVVTGNGGAAVVVPGNYAGEIRDTSTFSSNGTDRIVVTADTIDTSRRWDLLDVPYQVTGDLYVQGALNPVLTISDGVTVEFDSNVDIYVATADDGKLVVEGTSLGVLFTSSSGVPVPGAWGGVQLGTYDLGSTLDGLEITYAGQNGQGNLYLYYSEPKLTNVISRDSSQHGLKAVVSTVDVSSSTFIDNAGNGLDLDTSSRLATLGGPSFANNIVTGNSGNAIALHPESVSQLAPSSTYAGNGARIKILAGTVASTGTWRALDEDYHVVGDVYIQGVLDPVLTVEDGVTAMFDAAIDLYVGTGDGGKLVTNGDRLTGSGVLFTSSKTNPIAGDWAGVQFGTYDLGSALAGTTIEYAGANVYGNLYAYYANITLDEVISRYSSKDGLHATVATIDVAGSTFEGNNDYGVDLDASSAIALDTALVDTFKDNVLTGNGIRPMRLPAKYIGELDPSSTFVGNGTDLIEVTYDTVDINSTWNALDVPYEVVGDIYIQGAANPHVVVSDGVEVQHGTSVDLYVGTGDDGTIDVQGTTLGVVFTSNKAAPIPGDWAGVQLGTYSDGSILTGLTIEYAGSNAYGGLYAYYTNATVTNCTITNNTNDGIYSSYSTLVISGCNISNNADDGIRSVGSTMTVTDTVLSGNTGDGFEGDASSPLLAFTDNVVTSNGGAAMSVAGQFVGAVRDSSTFSLNGTDRVVITADTIETTQRWDDLSVPYRVIGDLYVQGTTDPVLTISDGVTVEFGTAVDLYVGSGDGGKLITEGTLQGVLFTSSATVPGPADWAGVHLGSYDNGSYLEGLEIAYGGSNTYGNLYAYYTDGVPTLVNFTSRDGANNGVKAVYSTLDISNSSFVDNLGMGLDLDTNSRLSTVAGPSFHDNVVTGNGSNAMSLHPESLAQLDTTSAYAGNGGRIKVLAGTIAATGTWRALDEDYQVAGDLFVQGILDPVVTVADGTTMFFDSGARFYVGNSDGGTLDLDGDAAGEGVLLTSSAVSPAQGDWDGLHYGDHSVNSVMTGTTVEYGGGGGILGNIYVYYSDLDMYDSTSRLSSSDGLYAQYSVVRIQGSSFLNNLGEGVFLDANSTLDAVGTPTFVGNTLTGNTSYPISLYANSVGQLDASSTYTGNGGLVHIDAGTVSSTQTWQDLDEDYYVSTDLYVQGILNPVLTLADGARYELDTAVDIYVGNSDDGTIFMPGGPVGVTLTSSKTVPNPGDWSGLHLGTYSDGTLLTDLTVEYAGANAYGNIYAYYSDLDLVRVTSQHGSKSGVYMTVSTAEINGSLLADNNEYGLYLDASSTLVGTVPSFTDNALPGNTWPASLAAASLIHLDYTSTFAGNSDDAVLVTGGTAGTTGTWQALDVPYRVTTDVHIQGPADPVVTIEPGTILEFNTSADLYVGNSDDGGLIALGEAGLPVLFTSSAVAPTPGSWSGIQLGDRCLEGSTILDQVTVEYGGGNGFGNVWLYYCNATVTNSTLAESSTWGAYCSSSATATLSGNTYLNNSTGTVFGCP